jgi:hypothetical protein
VQNKFPSEERQKAKGKRQGARGGLDMCN